MFTIWGGRVSIGEQGLCLLYISLSVTVVILATKALVNCDQARWHRGIATLCSHVHILQPTCHKTLSLLQLSDIHLVLQGESIFKD